MKRFPKPLLEAETAFWCFILFKGCASFLVAFPHYHLYFGWCDG